MWSKLKIMKNLIIGLVIGLGGLFIGVHLVDGLVTDEVEVRVEKLINQQLIGGNKDNMRTEIRYLIITDGGTFVCESALLKFKFNNSDIFFHLVEGKRYRMKVVGIGKSFITDYKNVIGVSLI